MNKEAKCYMNSVIDVIVRKHHLSELEVFKIVKKSFLYNSLINHLDETLHDDIETNADFVYEDFIRNKLKQKGMTTTTTSFIG